MALRDPRDALVSFYRLMEGWFLEPGAVSLEEMVRMRLATSNDQDGYWRHLNS